MAGGSGILPSMSEFNYDQFPTPTLQAEQTRIQHAIAELSAKHELIVQVIGRRALDAVRAD